MKISKKIVVCILVVAMTFANLNVVTTKKVSAATSKIGTMDFLKANGKVLKNCYGNGDTVYLRGTNAGGYMLQEFWMCPTNHSTNVSDQMDILNTLTGRFGSDAARSLVQAYETNYWTEADFDTCASLGINCIRLPLWYRNFVDEKNNWYSDAFERVDWFLEEAGERGIYVIIDMHGAYGSQNGSDHSGVDGGNNKIGASEFFFGQNATANQEKYYRMWEKLAQHFNGNPVVAGYDLLNEPYCTYRYNSGYTDDQLHSMLWDIYDKAYDRIRAIDRDHVIIMEATWDSWDLPNPLNYGWENVMYEYHNYEYSDYDNAGGTQITSMQKKINNIFSANYNVPSYMGEFSYFNNISAWEQGLQLLNDNGLNWTSWSYKCVAEYGNWGLVNQSVEKVNVETDSYDTILSKWSNVDSSYLNTNLANVFKKYTPGTVDDKNGATISEGKYYLDCNEKIVCAEDQGASPLVANRDSYSGAWETFHVINNDDGTISLKSDINGKYVCAVIDEKCQLLARSQSISLWEKFYLVHIQGNQYGLRAVANGKYVKADFDDTTSSGMLKAVSGSVAGAWEAFYFNEVGEETTTVETTTTQQQTTTSVQETTTQAASDGYTTASGDWNNLPYWSVYFAPDWGGFPTGGYKAGDSYNDFSVKVNVASGADWGIQMKTQAIAVEAGKTYICKVNVDSNMDTTSQIRFKEDYSQTETFKALSTGSNTFELQFTASDSAQIFFDLGQAPVGLEFTVTSFSLEKVEEETATEAPTTKEPTTEYVPAITISEDVQIEGYQISQTSLGFRTVSSVEPEINGQEVVEYGNIYAIIRGDVTGNDMYIGSDNEYVASFRATEEGITDKNYSDSETAINYVRTMNDNGNTSEALCQKYMIRAYAKLADGSYVYSDVCKYTIFNVAKFLYDNVMMPNMASHQNVYENILKIVDSSYAAVDYNWGNAVVKP